PAGRTFKRSQNFQLQVEKPGPSTIKSEGVFALQPWQEVSRLILTRLPQHWKGQILGVVIRSGRHRYIPSPLVSFRIVGVILEDFVVGVGRRSPADVVEAGQLAVQPGAGTETPPGQAGLDDVLTIVLQVRDELLEVVVEFGKGVQWGFRRDQII